MSPHSYLRFFLVTLLSLLLTTGISVGQTITLGDVPTATDNDRFFSDRFSVVHPSLSANGFDCGSNCDEGLGLKQILEGVYNDQDDRFVNVYEKLLTQAGKDLIPSANSRFDYENNAIRAEARAYVALVTYILEKNGENIGNLNGITGPDLPSTHDAALDDLRQALFDQALGNVVFFIPPNPLVAGNLGVTDDAVKWTATLTHLARTVDLYLALENAYQHYGDSLAPLLDQSEKSTLLLNFASCMDGLNELGNDDVPIDGTGVDKDEVQPGNWPMKVHVAVGYAALPVPPRAGALRRLVPRKHQSERRAPLRVFHTSRGLCPSSRLGQRSTLNRDARHLLRPRHVGIQQAQHVAARRLHRNPCLQHHRQIRRAHVINGLARMQARPVRAVDLDVQIRPRRQVPRPVLVRSTEGNAVDGDLCNDDAHGSREVKETKPERLYVAGS